MKIERENQKALVAVETIPVGEWFEDVDGYLYMMIPARDFF